MNLEGFDEARCECTEKVIIEGICLSFDLLRQVCLETGSCCVAMERPLSADDRFDLLQ